MCKDGALYKKIGKRIRFLLCQLLIEVSHIIYLISYLPVYYLLFSEHVENYDFSLVERFVGHGIGPILHSEPLILHHRELIFLSYQTTIICIILDDI